MLAWFISPKGDRVPVEAALKNGALAEYYPVSYLRACAQERVWSGKPSVTQLLKGTRQAYFMLKLPYGIDPDKQSFRIIGSTSHSTLENIADSPDSEIPLQDDDLSGVIDKIERVKNENWIVDYKTSGAYVISRFLGMESIDVPKQDEHGNVIRYKRSGKKNGKSYKVGDVRFEKSFRPTENRDDFEWTMQLNRYRILAERAGTPISRMKIFAMIRDGGTWNAEQYGIFRKTMYLDVTRLPDEQVNNFFEKKSRELVKKTESALTGFYDHIAGGGYPQDYYIQNAPPVCSPQESWNGRKCKMGYCPVAEYCKQKGDNPWI